MAKVAKKTKDTLTDADNPSLIQAGEEIHLRVLDDFFIEQELPKWKKFKKDWENLKTSLKVQFNDLRSFLQAIDELDEGEDKKEKQKTLDALKKGQKKLDDDRFNIKGKHEDSVAKGVEKMVRFTPKTTWLGRIKIRLGLQKAPVPVDVAFTDLKAHMTHVTTEELAKWTAAVREIERKCREAGQYVKADRIKDGLERIVYDMTLVNAGFTTYVDERQMVEFLQKSERGVMVDFLRYYEKDIPEDVLALKKKADDLMVFDNYVVAYYADFKKKAKEQKKEKAKKDADAAVAARRDPILFGVIKESRRLYYIADWTTENDGLTLEVVEKLLGEEVGKLSKEDTAVVASVPQEVMGSTVRTYNDISNTSSTVSYNSPVYTWIQ